jgi:hypothetical protein
MSPLMASPARDVQRLRKICEPLPEVLITEHGRHTGFEVRRKKFAWHVIDEFGDGRVAVICKAGPGENEVLVSSDSERFFFPKYMTHHGWVGVYLDVPAVDWDEIRELVTDAYLLMAPKRLAREVLQR